MALQRTQQLLRIASRNFWRFRLQAVLTVLATIAGTAGVIVSTGYAAGGRQKVIDQLSALGTNVLTVTPQQSKSIGGRSRTGSVVTTLNLEDYKAIKSTASSLVRSSATVSTVLRVRAGDLTKNTTILGCEPSYFEIKNWQVSSGTAFDAQDDRQQARVVLLGEAAAHDLFDSADPTGEVITINRIPFAVVGVLAERGQGLDASNEDDQVYVPLQTSMRRLMNVDHVNGILFQVDHWTHMDATAAQISRILQERHRKAARTELDFQVQNQKGLLDTQLSSFARLTFLIRWIALSTLAVSSLGVFALTWIGVRNRTREIGTRRAIGAIRRDVLIQFFAEGALGTLSGCVIGLPVSYLALQMIDARVGQPFLFAFPAAVGEAAAAVALYSVFTLLSSLRAIRIEPLVALRSE